MDEEQEGASVPPQQPLQPILDDDDDDDQVDLLPSDVAAAASSPATLTAESGFRAAELDLFWTSLAGTSSSSRSAPSSSGRANDASEQRRRSESSVPAFERDDELLPSSAIAPDKRSFALDDLSTVAVFRVRPSSISANSPVYSSFEHPTPALERSSSFAGLPPSVAESFAVPHPPSRATSSEEISFIPDGSEDPIPTGSVVLNAATSTPPVHRSAGHGSLDSGEFSLVLAGSPPPFALPLSSASLLSPPQYSTALISDSDVDVVSASSFFTPDTPGSFASTSLYTPAVLANPTTRPRNNSVNLNAGSGSRRRCEVYIGSFGKDPLLLRYAKWLHAELESHAVACFSADRSLYADQRSHDVARGIMHASAFGVVLISRKSFRNPYTIEELTIFLDQRNLVPVFFDVAPSDCLVRDVVEKRGEIWDEEGGELWKVYMGEEKGWSEAVKGLLKMEDFRIEAHQRNWRESIQRVVALVGSKLGRPNWEKARRVPKEELPWPRNPYFAGREKELKLIEKVLFTEPVGHPNYTKPGEPTVLSRRSDTSSKTDTEDMDSSRPSNYDGESYEDMAWNVQTGSGLKDAARRTRRASREKRLNPADRRFESDWTRYAAACTVTGIPGIGKSELALEFAYRHLQKYRMVLWVGGEACYLRQNYLNLSTSLGLNVSTESTTSQPGKPRSLEDMESEAVQKIRHELQKGIPYLLIIDNLDSFDGRELAELLPRAGSATHVVITTRLPRVMRLACLSLPYLSSFEALTLMRDGKQSERSLSVQQIDTFKEFEDKFRRLPFGLAIVGRLINEFNMKPSEILAKMGTMDTKRIVASSAIERDDVVLRSNPFLVKLLDVCFNLIMGAKSLAVRMAYVGAWFAPAPCPLSLLALAAKKLEKEGRVGETTSLLRSCYPRPSSRSARSSERDARDLLTRLGVARAALRSGCDCLYFPDIVQVYCQKRGGVLAARAFVHVMRTSGNLVRHSEHFWAATYLVCRYGSDASVVELPVPELLDFTRRLVMPLAIRSFQCFARCNASLEVLRLCYEMLEDVEKSYVTQIQDRWDRSLGRRRDASIPHQVDEYVWQELTLLKALLLEARAKLLMRGGRYDVGEGLCRTCISIRTVMLGADHSDTLAAQETLSKFVRYRNSSSTRPALWA